MKLSKNKKGMIWPILIALLMGGIVTALIIGKVIIAGQRLAFDGINMTKHFGLAGGDAPNTFLFEARTISISEDNFKNDDCKVVTDPKTESIKYDCKPNKEINFKTYIYNGGAAQRRFYGGIVVCEMKCNRRGKSCDLVDKTCNDRVIDSVNSGTCTIKNGETDLCDAGYFTFKDNTRYFVYPVATCELDPIYGCSGVGMTSPERRRNTDVGIRVVTIQTTS